MSRAGRIHAHCTDGTTLCGNGLHTPEPLTLDAVTCLECRSALPFVFEQILQSPQGLQADGSAGKKEVPMTD